MPLTLDDYLLELILMDTIAIAGGRARPGAERAIQRFLPRGLYDQIIAYYDLSFDSQADDDPNLLGPWLKKAAGKDSRWKRRMIIRFLRIMRCGGPVGAAELTEVAALAAAMGASRECRQVFGYIAQPLRPGRGIAIKDPSLTALSDPRYHRSLQ